MSSPDISSETLPQASHETPEQRWRFFTRALRILAPAFGFVLLTACSSEQSLVPPVYAVPIPQAPNYATPTPDFAGTPEFTVTPDSLTVIPGPMPTPPADSAEVSNTPTSSYTPSATERPQATVTATPTTPATEAVTQVAELQPPLPLTVELEGLPINLREHLSVSEQATLVLSHETGWDWVSHNRYVTFVIEQLVDGQMQMTVFNLRLVRDEQGNLTGIEPLSRVTGMAGEQPTGLTLPPEVTETAENETNELFFDGMTVGPNKDWLVFSTEGSLILNRNGVTTVIPIYLSDEYRQAGLRPHIGYFSWQSDADGQLKFTVPVTYTSGERLETGVQGDERMLYLFVVLNDQGEYESHFFQDATGLDGGGVDNPYNRSGDAVAVPVTSPKRVESVPSTKPVTKDRPSLGYQRGFDARQVFQPVRELKPKPQYRRTA